MSNYYEEMISRNIGVITASAQQALRRSTIAVAGCGCMGGMSTELLARAGVGRLKIADPDSFEINNINRQCGAYSSTIGENKARVLERIIKDINPSAIVDVYLDPVTQQNVEDFVDGADLVIDGIDYYRFADALALSRVSRRRGLYVITAVAVGFGANIFVFAPDKMSLEEYAGFPTSSSEEETSSFVVPPEKYCPVLPSYVSPKIVEKIASHQIEIPSISVAQAIGSGAITAQALLILTGKRPSAIVPDFLSINI